MKNNNYHCHCTRGHSVILRLIFRLECRCEERSDEAIQKDKTFFFGLLRFARNDRFRAAFTLAEVLMTLAIIGIVASMTVPALMNSTNKTENVVALKKAYETLSQAYLMISAENGDITGALSGVTTHDGFANVFISKLNVQKNCGTASALATGCFPNTIYKYLDGTTNWTNISIDSSWSTISTNDGISYAFKLYSTNCTSDLSSPAGTTSSPLYNTCGQVLVDINGSNKGPALFGRDLFVFHVIKKGIYPRGSYPDIFNSNCLPTSNGGSACTSKVLLEGAMNY